MSEGAYTNPWWPWPVPTVAQRRGPLIRDLGSAYNGNSNDGAVVVKVKREIGFTRGASWGEADWTASDLRC